MAGYSGLYVIGDVGGFLGSDGVNSIKMFILVGDASRQWLEPHYVDKTIKPMGKIRRIVPSAPNHRDSLLDACIAFFPQYFASCPSIVEVESALHDLDHLDFDAAPQKIPEKWGNLREEARALLVSMNIWSADFEPVKW